MKINTVLILCAGFGKRLKHLTTEKPKPLLEVNNITLLENTINLVEKLNIFNVKINSFYLKDQIKNFISKKKFKLNIEIIEDGNTILDTGGGILNLVKNSIEKDFLVFNPDTLWNLDYKKIIKLSKEEGNNYIFTGCQMINKELFSNFDTIPFSITKIWEKQISENTLYGYESLNEFIHITDLEIYEKLIKNY